VFQGTLPTQDFAWSPVEFSGDQSEVFWAVDAQVCSFREVLAEQWSGPLKLDTLIEPYAMADVWARYSSGLRLPSRC
jgi:hypothetical protein